MTVIAAALAAVPLALISACTTNQQAGNQSTTPSGTASPPPGTERLTTQLRTADGRQVANATIDFANGYATVTVETVAGGILSPGFHGLHIHSVGKCDADSVAPTGGDTRGDFLSAGGHFQVNDHTGHPASGDLTSLEVRSDGSAKLVTTTNAFNATDLRGGQGTALVIHQDPDDFGNIPPRYQINGTGGPDPETLATGDSGKRVACGVIAAPSAGSSVSTSTSTVTTTVTSPAPSVTGTSTTPSSSVVTTAPSTDTTTVTTTPVTTTVLPPPGG